MKRRFRSICLITQDVRKLCDFYQKVPVLADVYKAIADQTM